MTGAQRRLSYLCLQVTREGQASHAHVHEIVEGLRRHGWAVTLFEPRCALSDRAVPLGIRLSALAQAQWRLCFGQERPDVVYVRAHFAALPVALWARLRGVPCVQEVNGPYEDLFISHPGARRLRALFQWAAGAQLRLATAVIAVTPQLARWLAREGVRGRVFVVPNGANTCLFTPRATHSRDLPASYAVFFGALARWQGLSDLLDAVRDPEWPPGTHLVIAGDGAERGAVERAARANPRLVYLGSVPYAEVPGIVAGSCCGLSPQTDLGGRAKTGLFPLKVFETMACAVPVIVTDWPGQADLVRQHGCGVVVPPNDPGALARAVRSLCEDPRARDEMGRRGRAAVVRYYSWDRRAAETSEAIEEALRAQRVR